MQLLVGTDDLTNLATGLSFSNSDPGGYEACSFTVNTDYAVKVGTRVIVVDGLSVVWLGRVSEVTRNVHLGRSSTQVGCEGYVAVLKDNLYSMIYVDTDLSRWVQASVQRKINLLLITIDDQAGLTVTPDATTGQPSLENFITGAWARAARSEAYYDAGSTNTIASLYYAWKITSLVNSADANWTWQALLSSDDILTTSDQSANLRAAGPSSGTISATGPRRFAGVFSAYSAAAGAEGSRYSVFWTCLAAYGPHGLTKRGPSDLVTAQGFYPSDIARHALLQVRGITPGVIVDATSYVCTQSVYRTPAPPSQVVDDMNKLVGWHWGVWEPLSSFDGLPRMDFRPPPSDATASVARSACEDLSLGGRLDSMYDTAIITYTDAAGSSFSVTTTLANPPLAESGFSRTLTLDMGIGNVAAAKTYGIMLLQLSQSSQRAVGSATLPSALTDGRPAHLLKAGIDRLRVTDLPDVGPITDTDTRRRDTFRISRVETTVDDHGVPKTKVEIDNGANLLEVLQARLALAVGKASAG